MLQTQILIEVFNSTISYIASNLISIIITIILSLTSIYGTQRYIKKAVVSAQRERRNRAKNDLLDVLEVGIANKDVPTSTRINHLKSAIERKHSVPLEDMSDIAILEDLILRVQESSHLDPGQKNQQTEEVEHVIETLENQRETDPLPSNEREVIDGIKANIESGNENKAINYLDTLEEIIVARKAGGAYVYSDPMYISNIKIGSLKLPFYNPFAAIEALFQSSDFFPSQKNRVFFIILLVILQILIILFVLGFIFPGLTISV